MSPPSTSTAAAAIRTQASCCSRTSPQSSSCARRSAEASSVTKRIDWNTILLLGGIITYVGVLTRLGAIDQLGEAARSVSSPLVAAFVICVVAALVSAFASTIGIIGALVPLAVPLLVPGGGLEMTGFIYALAISASLVDCAPFGTTGATIVASTVEEHRARVNRNLTRWGLSTVIIGPVVTLATMVVPFVIAG
ncbi:SLC13 family permease [Brachybacterium sp. J153]|uniref:SLC13 family permease n=1 Tax=Brachybacterium sp. J153 TaxID=3116488 RepID=UPI002E7770E9|nr:SLC13 family permease [Brachybacterium sp. J153]MEE1619662.1 SLC13 family permease [Brachybacterium sp. J153]